MNKLKKFTSGLLATSIIAGGFLSIGTNSFADSDDTFEEFLEELKEDNVKIPDKNLDKVKSIYKEIIKLEIKEDQAKTDEEEDKIEDEIEKLEQKAYDLGIAIDSNYKKGDDDYLEHSYNDDYDSMEDSLEELIDDIDDTRDFDEFVLLLEKIDVKLAKYNKTHINNIYNKIKKLEIEEDLAKTDKEEDEIELKIDRLEEQMYDLLNDNVIGYLHVYNIDEDDLSESKLKEASKIYENINIIEDKNEKRKEYIKLRYLVGIDNKNDKSNNKELKSLNDIIIEDCGGSIYEFNQFEKEEKEEIISLYNNMKEDIKANRYDWVIEELEEIKDIYEDEADDLNK
ncbi:hypothetical protein WG909_06305 [Peptostreptococcaceae bacterium AGR-M142]